MYQLFILLHVFISICLILVVLMQSGRGGGVAGAFGGGGNQTVFGGRGATDFLGKATWGLGGGFMFTSLLLGVLSAHRTEAPSVIEKTTAAPQPPSSSAPAVPGQQTPSTPAAPPAGNDNGSAPGDEPAPSGGN
ncbi:MAG: preprotein translocase subunit SecG [Candidatus Eisenbacteria bacterium]